MSRTLLAATTALSLLAVPAGASPSGTWQSAEGGVLRPGQPVSGELRSGDALLDAGEYNDVWTSRVRRGQT